MFLPVIYLIIKNLMIFLFVSLAHQNAPKPVTNNLQAILWNATNNATSDGTNYSATGSTTTCR